MTSGNRIEKNPVRSGSMSAILAVLCVSLLTPSCGTQNSHRESAMDQQVADSQAKYQELAPAEGAFSGQMRLSRSGESFTSTLTIQRVMDNTRTTQSTDPSVTVALAKLSGNLRFPAIDRIDSTDRSEFTDYAEILNPLGGLGTALIDFGDFNPRNQQLVLPYNVASYTQGSYGELSGTLTQDHFTGTWFSKPYGTVATFDLIKTPAPTGGNP